MDKAWQERYNSLVGTFPSLNRTDWGSAFREDPDIFTALLADLVKVKNKQLNPGKKRPALSKREVLQELARLADADYSTLDFYQTFKILVGNRSIRSVSNRTGLGKSYVYQLLNKERTPSFETLEKIAKGFKKHPSYFLEWRVGFILYNLDKFLTASPEIAITWYNKTRKSFDNKIEIG